MAADLDLMMLTGGEHLDDGYTQTRSSSPDTTSSFDACGTVAGCNGTLVKRPWTPEEDTALVAAVHKYGACRWSMIATQLSTGRVGKQCRERWNNHLCPEVKKTEWSEDEDRAILQGVAVLGTRWCEIIKAPPLSGRTDNAIKNRFYSLQRRMKARQAGGHRRGRQSGGDEEAPMPGQTDRIMAIATELAFATDESERDRLIELLTATLHEDAALEHIDDGELSDIGAIDSPHELEQLEGLSSELGFGDFESSGKANAHADAHADAHTDPHTDAHTDPHATLHPDHAAATAMADLLKLPHSPCDGKMRSASPLPSSTHLPLDEPMAEMLTDTSSTTSTISPDGAGGAVALCPSSWALATGHSIAADCGHSIADQLPALVDETVLDLSPTCSVDSEGTEGPLTATREDSLATTAAKLAAALGTRPDDEHPNTPPIHIDADAARASVQVTLPAKRTLPHERTAEERGVSFGGAIASAHPTPAPAPAARPAPSTAAPPAQVLRDTHQVLRALSPGVSAALCGVETPPAPPTAANTTAVCLGGRHAYRAFLAPLKLPVAEAENADSPKRLRTATGHTAGTPTGDGAVPATEAAVRKVGTKSPRGGPSPLAAASAAAAAAAAATAAVAAAGLTMRAATGTEEPGAAAFSPASPMSELLSVSFFNDLFDAEATGAGGHAPSPAAAVPKGSIVVAMPTRPSPTATGGTRAPMPTLVARSSPGRGARRSARQPADVARGAKHVTFAATLA